MTPADLARAAHIQGISEALAAGKRPSESWSSYPAILRESHTLHARHVLAALLPWLRERHVAGYTLGEIVVEIEEALGARP